VQLVLSLFPGFDLLGLAFKREGFCVVQGGDVIWGGDVREEHYPPGRFDGVIGGPPCQAFSRLAHMVRQNGYEPKFGNLIPEFERIVNEVQPTWFVMENVPDAPTPQPYFFSTWSTLLNNRQCFDEDGKPAKQNRVRRWTFGDRRIGKRAALMIDVAALESIEFEYAATGGSQDPVPIKFNRGMVEKSCVKARRNGKGRMPWNARTRAAVIELLGKQGLPADAVQHLPMTTAGLCKALGNGVPLPMGRAIAKAVKEATETL